MRFTIADTIIARCFAHPDRVAVETVGKGDRMTYGEVWRRTYALADAVSECTAGRHGKAVGLLLPNRADAALAIAACQHAGVIAVPINGRLTTSEMQFILDDADVRLVLTGGELAQAAAEACAGSATAVRRVEDVATPDRAPRPELGVYDSDGHPSVIGYTSGTTGFPKGAVYTHDYYTMNNYRWGWVFGLTYDHVVLIAGPMFHLSYAGFTLAGLSAGARVRILPRFDPEIALDELRGHCTFAFLVPSMLAMIAERWEHAGRPPLTAARHIISAGAPASLDLLRAAMQMFPNAKIAEMYGWTEGTFATYEIKDPATLEPNCVGWPALGADVAVFAENGEPCGPGEAGEVGVRSGVPFAGYLGNPAATEASTHRGYIMSGDIGRWLPDGRLCIIDRKKDMIISGGENVYTAEVERVLLEHPEIEEAAVVGLPDPTWGEIVAAMLVVAEGSELGAEEAIAFCRERMAGYKCPRHIEIASELPRNSMGKVQKFKLVELLSR
jgi:acyl-CoA synthetase (AMP-forming)/AMP-acid ligase II